MDTKGGRNHDGDVTHEIFVPGRLCVLGEHTDWAAGYRDRNRSIPPGLTLVATTQEGLHARVMGRRDGRFEFKACTSSSADRDLLPVAPLNVPMTEEALQSVVADGGFYMYVAGTMLVTCSRFGLLCTDSEQASPGTQVSGLSVDNFLTTLPLKKGLSSSAAVCVLVVKALCLVYGLELAVPQVMELAHLGEARAASKCGRMDQCCALGTNHVAAMFFDGEDVKIYEVVPPESGVFLVVADLNGSKDTIKMLSCLNDCFPVAQMVWDVGRLGAISSSVPTVHYLKHKLTLLRVVFGGCAAPGAALSHPWSCNGREKNEEHERVHAYVRANTELAWRAVTAVERGDARELGRVMTEAQANFDQGAIPVCPSEFSSPLLHAVMSEPRLKDLTWGIKGVGAQGDGSVQLLARGGKEQAEITRVLREMGMNCVLSVTIKKAPTDYGITSREVAPLGSNAGTAQSSPARPFHSRRVCSAVVVAAGLSTRMFPASAVVKKELFPIVDQDGVCKPVILAILEGLAESGIDRFVIVVQEKDVDVFDGFFSMEAMQAHKHRLTPEQRSYMEKVQALRRRITYSIQEKQEGFGHAVYCARHSLGIQASESCGKGRSVESTVDPQIMTHGHTNGHAVPKNVSSGVGSGEKMAKDDGDGDGDEAEAFLLVLGDHLYRRGAGSTSPCASQLIHAYLEHGEAGKPAIGLKVMEESAVSPYGVAAGECVAYPPAQTVQRWQKATACARASSGPGSSRRMLFRHLVTNERRVLRQSPPRSGMKTGAPCVPTTASPASASANGGKSSSHGRSPLSSSAGLLTNGAHQTAMPLGGRVYRLTQLVEKPTAEFARENLVTSGLGPSECGEGRHLVVFGQYILPAKRTFDILAENIKLDRRERGEFQLTSVLERMREEDDGMLGCIIHGDALDMGIPSPYVATMEKFSKPHQM